MLERDRHPEHHEPGRVPFLRHRGLQDQAGRDPRPGEPSVVRRGQARDPGDDPRVPRGGPLLRAVRDRPRAHVRGSPRADPGQLPRLVQWNLEGPHGRVATPETLALHDEPQGRRGPLPRHLPLLLRRRGHPRPDLPYAARGPFEYVPPAGRVQPGRPDPRTPHAPLGPDPARRGLRELLRPDPDRRARYGVPAVECPELLGLPRDRSPRPVELLRAWRDRGLGLDDLRAPEHGRVQPRGRRLDDGPRPDAPYGLEHRVDGQLPHDYLPAPRSLDVADEAP